MPQSKRLPKSIRKYDKSGKLLPPTMPTISVPRRRKPLAGQLSLDFTASSTQVQENPR